MRSPVPHVCSTHNLASIAIGFHLHRKCAFKVSSAVVATAAEGYRVHVSPLSRARI